MFNLKVKRRKEAELRKLDSDELQLRLDCSKILLLIKESEFMLSFIKMVDEGD